MDGAELRRLTNQARGVEAKKAKAAALKKQRDDLAALEGERQTIPTQRGLFQDFLRQEAEKGVDHAFYTSQFIDHDGPVRQALIAYCVRNKIACELSVVPYYRDKDDCPSRFSPGPGSSPWGYNYSLKVSW